MGQGLQREAGLGEEQKETWRLVCVKGYNIRSEVPSHLRKQRVGMRGHACGQHTDAGSFFGYKGRQASATERLKKPTTHYREECEPVAKAQGGKQGKASLGHCTEPELDEDLEELLNKARDLLAKQLKDGTNKTDTSPVDWDLPKKQRTAPGPKQKSSPIGTSRTVPLT
ncbi:hypothetical protein NDU88_009711 [Pleurodeles waltl]|uniref:Uncharacterized protein n=1 Tax=Pleurodeles waltl TaxID=8319 RepID=A0AAV7S171_PLEWA|nr:hypothetical protein NDU88_009711 [Pleurodeles waltl]